MKLKFRIVRLTDGRFKPQYLKWGLFWRDIPYDPATCYYGATYLTYATADDALKIAREFLTRISHEPNSGVIDRNYKPRIYTDSTL